MVVELFGVDDGERMLRAFAVRRAVFVREQGVPEAEEIDAHDRSDASACHALIAEAGSPVAAGRFFARSDGAVQIGRMAVLAGYRGRGYGRALLDALVAEAQRRGYRRVVLHAQTHACGFYELAGFSAHGPEFLDAGILHVEMERTIAPQNDSARIGRCGRYRSAE